MTVRDAYEYALIEINKVKAPSLLLEDYIYLFNKAIQQYVNIVYNRCEYNQQSSDDLSFLQTTYKYESLDESQRSIVLNDKVWTVELPKDYLHLLNCIVSFEHPTANCTPHVANCQRITADLYAGVQDNYYMKPSHKKPYYHIINRNDSGENEERDALLVPSDTIRLWEPRTRGSRNANPTPINMEIHTGNTVWDLDQIVISYLKAPMYVTMSDLDVLSVQDNTQTLEFPDYVCYEVINIFVKLVLENAGNPRLQTNLPINQTIAVPGQQ